MRKTDAALALFGLFCLIAMCMFIGIRLDRYMTDKGMDRFLVDFFVTFLLVTLAIITSPFSKIIDKNIVMFLITKVIAYIAKFTKYII